MIATTQKPTMSQGWASGQAGPFICAWNTAAISSEPRAALDIGVRITEIATTPKKNGQKLQAACLVPERKNAGVCQTAATTPTISADHRGANLRCSSGSATPRQPSSSMGPMNSAGIRAGSTPYQGSKGK